MNNVFNHKTLVFDIKFVEILSISFGLYSGLVLKMDIRLGPDLRIRFENDPRI